MRLPKIAKSKKGLVDLVFYIMGYLVGIVVILGLFTILFFSVFKGSADTYHMEHYLYSSRLAFSQDSVFLQDELTGRMYPWIVDTDKLKQEQVEKLFLGEPDFGSAFTLEGQGPVGINLKLYTAASAVYQKGDVFGGTQLRYPVVVAGKRLHLTEGVMFYR
tara:strand:- start:2943 stop:3425 length:483 start_codon:yes stop_codon:yes gene_type:complete